MKVAPGFRLVVFLVLGLVAASASADAQIGLSVTASASTIGINDSLTYTLNFTNVTGSPAYVTNSLTGPAVFVSASPTDGLYLTNATTAVFYIDPSVFTTIVQLTVTVQSTDAGSITNGVSVVVPLFATNIMTASIVTQVTNASLPEADLAVAMTGPAQSVITNDYVSYGVTVSNLGPGDAAGVFLTNTLPPGVRLISVLPSSLAFTVSGSNVVFDVGALTNGAVENFFLRIQPTNAGISAFSATVNSSGITDPNPTNNVAVTNISVGGYLSGVLVATNVSPTQVFDPQNGLMEQTVGLANTGSSSAASTRIVVTGLTKTNWLFNASGTNNGVPFVTYAGNLDPGQAAGLRMQYLVPTGRPFAMSNSQLQAYSVPSANLAAPAPPGTPVAVSRIVPLVTGHMLIEFPSTPGQSYTVVYYVNGDFSHPLMAPPSITAPADKTQWIDYGPPTTLTDPTNAAWRFYRVYASP